MDRDQTLREGERAAIERWFPKGPMGQMFDAGDGVLLNMRADAIPGWRDQGFALIDGFIASSRAEAKWQVPVFCAFALGAFIAARWAGIQSGASFMGILGLGAIVLHGWPTWKLWRYRRDLAALRTRIRGSLAAATPLPRDYGARFQRRNYWRVALNIWVYGLILTALASQHFLTPDRFPVAGVWAVFAAVGVAWGLHFLSRRVDLSQQR